MDLSQLIAIAPTAALVMLAAACLALLWSMALFRRSRSNVFWRQRRQSGQRGLRMLLLGLALSLVSAVSCVFGVAAPRLLPLVSTVTLIPTAAADAATQVLPVQPTTAVPPTASDTPSATPAPPTAPATASFTIAAALTTTLITATPTSTATVTLSLIPASLTATATRTAAATRSATPTRIAVPTQTGTPTASDTPSPTATRTPSATPSLTSTATVTPTATLTPTPTETLIPLGRVSTLHSNVTPSPIARLTIVALDSQVSPEQKPVAPATVFPQGIRRIFFFVEFSNMRNGTIWRRELRYNGETLQDSDFLWGLQDSGTAYFFIGQPTGFAAGTYELRLYIGSSKTPMSTVVFTVN
jgi:hypothetical protein